VHPTAGARTFTSVSVAGTPAVEFCLDPDAGDAVADWFLTHGWIDEPVMRAVLGLVRPGTRMIDLGCHLGTFSLSAASLGAKVIAVDAATSHVELLGESAARNGFDDLHVVQGVISDAAGTVEFHENGIHGRVWRDDDGAAATIDVPAVTVDGLLDSFGWDGADLIKIDIEGGEVAALKGMGRLFARGARPVIVFECNGSTLPLYGASIPRLRSRLTELGYELLMIDHLRPGTLVERAADSVQPECVTDYIAVCPRPDGLDESWRIEAPFGLEQTVTRVLDGASSIGAGYRRYAADLLRDGPAWLTEHPLAAPATTALELDEDPGVRDAGASRAAEHARADAPPSVGLGGDLVMLAESISLYPPATAADRPDGTPPVLRDASLHLRAGQSLAVLAPDDPQAATALLWAIAGWTAPAAGTLQAGGRTVLLAPVAAGFEPELTVGENATVFGAFVGCDVADVRARVASIVERAGLTGSLDQPLRTLPVGAALRLALSVALECVNPRILLIDAIDPVTDAADSSSIVGLTWQLRSAGTAIVQVVKSPSESLAPPDRMAWLVNGTVLACGHVDSIVAAAR
jgi:FkbM family methyltransferase